MLYSSMTLSPDIHTPEHKPKDILCKCTIYDAKKFSHFNLLENPQSFED